jgi:hypothetical protein
MRCSRAAWRALSWRADISDFAFACLVAIADVLTVMLSCRSIP